MQQSRDIFFGEPLEGRIVGPTTRGRVNVEFLTGTSHPKQELIRLRERDDNDVRA